jgi:cytochrome c-type biogenesis protein CcmF
MIGNLLITATIITGIFTVIMYYYTFKGYTNTLMLARRGFYLMTGFITAASAFLLYLILTHQYQYSYVFEYSSSDLSFGLLLSTFYAGQEGSFLLWLFFAAVTGLFLIKNLSDDTAQESSFMMVYTMIAVFLAVLISPFLKNPFTSIWADPNYVQVKYFDSSYLGIPELQKFIFSNKNSEQFLQIGPQLKAVLSSLSIPVKDFITAGKGLNPLLQNFWMQIHPPLLFVGFAMASIPYSFAMSAIIRKDYRTWISKSLPWLSVSMAVLGLAIMIGGYWAYGVLGWGGFWGWDPVENSSLVPWIIGMALLHTLIIQKNTQLREGKGKYVRTNLVLSVLTFVFVIYSTFLTRSGILSDASVHSFVAPGMTTYIFLLGFILTFTILGIGGVILRWKDLKNVASSNESFLSRENGLLYGAALMLGTALIIIMGTSAPIFGTSVDTSFYTKMNFPLAILIMFLIAFTLILRWRSTPKKEIIKGTTIHMLISLAATAVIAFAAGMVSIYFMIYTLTASLTVVTNISTIIKNLRINYLLTGGQIAHIGVGIFLIGVLLSGNFSKEQEITLPKGKEIKALNHSFMFTGYNSIDNGEKYSFNVEIKDGNKVINAAPVMFISAYNNSLMREPDILPGLAKDIYISPLGYDENGTDTGAGSGPENQKNIVLKKGESFKFNDAKITFIKFLMPDNAMKDMMNGNTFEMGAELNVNYNGMDYSIEPAIRYSNNKKDIISKTFKPANLKFELLQLDAAGSINLNVSSINKSDISSAKPQQVLTIEASIKQNMNLVWIGVIFITAGLLVAAFRRRRENLQKKRTT